MSLIIPANSAVSGGFDVANSLMFNRADVPYLDRTAGTPTNSKINTLSVWLKRSGLGAATFFNGGTNDQNQNFINFNPNNKIFIQNTASNSNNLVFVTTQVFRDPSAWYHIVVAIDTTQGTASNRVKLYVNGVQVTVFDTETQPSQNLDVEWNKSGATLEIGKYPFDSSGYSIYDGYMSEFVFIDGLQLTPTSFGEFDEDSGIWKPIDVSGLTFGTNGFYLDFEDSANLGNDANGGTDLTENNIAATDQMIDTCTKNFPTLNSLEGASSAVGTNTYSQGNLQVLTPVGANGNTLSSIGVSSGKWCSEFYIKASSGVQRPLVGVSGDVGATLLVSNNMGSLSGARDVGYMGNDGDKFVSGSESSYGGSAFSNGDVIGVALDLDNNTVNFAQNNSFKGTIAIASTGTWHMGCGDVSGGIAATIVANYGQNSSFAGSITAANNTDEHGEGLFKFAPPSGFITLNSTNLGEYGG